VAAARADDDLGTQNVELAARRDQNGRELDADQPYVVQDHPQAENPVGFLAIYHVSQMTACLKDAVVSSKISDDPSAECTAHSTPAYPLDLAAWGSAPEMDGPARTRPLQIRCSQ
jgi:hypothetical protein